MLSYLILGFAIGYLVGGREWKKIADEACAVAGHSLLLAEHYKETHDRS